jgi:hypothetical protein
MIDPLKDIDWNEVWKSQMQHSGVQNISVVQKRWEDVDVKEDLQPPYDVVIASFSLGMPGHPSGH